MVKITCYCDKCEKELDTMYFDNPENACINNNYLSQYDHFGKFYEYLAIGSKRYMVCKECATIINDIFNNKEKQEVK